MCPLQFETLCHSIVGHVLFALHRAQVAKVKVAAKAVALVVVGLGTQAPRALGVDFAQGLEVHIVVDGPIVATIAQVKSAARFVAIRWHDKARRILFVEREEAVGYGQRQWHVLHHQVCRSEHHVLARPHLGTRQCQIKVRVLGIAGGVTPLFEVECTVGGTF